MKVALVIEKFHPRGGGAERSTLQIAEDLRSRGHDIVILAGCGNEFDDLPFPVHCLHKGRRLRWWRLRRFAGWARQMLAAGDYDASISVSTAVPAMIVQPRGGTIRATLGQNIAMRSSAGARLLKRLSLLVSPKQQLLLSLERQTMSDLSVRRFAAVSDYVARQLQERYGIDPSRIAVIPNAAVMPKADQAQRQQWRNRLREAYSITPQQTVYLFAAMNPRLKGWPCLLEAMRSMVQQGHHPMLLAAGDVNMGDLNILHRMGLRDAVRIVGPVRDVAPLYCAADVTVLPTWYDPSSKVVIESLMMGTPAITTSFNGAAGLVVDGEHPARGRVIERPDHINALADAMIALMNPEERQRCRDACAGLADQLSMKRHVDQLEELLHSVTGSSAPVHLATPALS
ncbi:MAG: glycosyltransferase family 4 protein [Phycisphaeraceae bacterium]|nr:glycosyltransferase family 4 protein [Phycisphaeraceae bacterium]